MSRKRIKIFFSIAIIFALAVFFVFSKKKAEAPEVKNTEINQDFSASDKLEEKEVMPIENSLSEKKVPEKFLMSVPFTAQAPFAKWDALHEEVCEEASIIMLKYYLDKKPLTPEIAEKEIQKMVEFEIKNYGDFKDTTASETAKLAEDFYGLSVSGKKLRVLYDFSKEDLKKYLAKGNPVIVPAAGRELKNPNFTAPGPLYHNLVLVGYDKNIIITNDPGTRKGRGYIYDMDVLYNAIHDFPGKPENIIQGRKAMIVLE
jgi:hypothetical protein